MIHLRGGDIYLPWNRANGSMQLGDYARVQSLVQKNDILVVDLPNHDIVIQR